VAFNQLEDTNALLLYRVGPVLMCSPSLQVESVIVPPAISRASASSEAEPGIFKSMYGMVRVVDLRVRFGVEAAQRKQPGQIIIVEVSGGHAGFWVDEIEDVIAFPQTGWSQVPSHVPGSVFSRALMQAEDIRLYAEFDRLDSFKASGYLREHIRSLQQTTQTEKNTPIDNNPSPAQSASPQSQSAPSQATPGQVSVASSTDAAAETDIQSTGRSDQVNGAINTSSTSPIQSSIDSPVKPPVKPAEKTVAARNTDAQHTAVNHSVSTQQSHVASAQAQKHSSAVSGLAEKPQKTDRQLHHQPSPMQAGHKAERQTGSNARHANSVTPPANQALRSGDDYLQIKTSSTEAEPQQSTAGWLWWSVPLLLLFIVLLIFMQNSRPLQKLIAQDETSSLQTRVDLQQDTVVFQAEPVTDSDAMQYDLSTAVAVETEIEPVVQVADDVSDVVYVEPATGDLTITVNDYEEDSASRPEISVEDTVQNQLPSQERKVEGQDETEQQQLSTEAKPVDTELASEAKEPQVTSKQEVEDETEVVSSVNAKDVDKKVPAISRRLQHIVVEGDTLWSITGHYINKPWRYPEIARLSNIDNPHLIYPGQRVIIVLNYKNRSE